MRARLSSTALVALTLAAAAPAGAQEPGLEAVPQAAQETEAETSATRSDIGQRVFREFRRDGEIDPCAHSLRRLERTRDEMPATRAENYPDFLPAVEAAIEEREELSDAECERLAEAERAEQERLQDEEDETASGGDDTEDADPTPTPTATPTPTPTPAPTATPAPAAPATPAPAPAPAPAPVPSAPSLDDSPTPEATVEPDATAPAVPEIAPAPTPAPTVVPPPPPAPAPAQPTVVTRRDPDGPTPVLLGAILGGPFALLGLLGLVLATLAKLGIAEEPRARLRHAWGEAAYRAGATWGDFVDWLRLGR